MTTVLIIKVDSNDADYLTEETNLEEFDNKDEVLGLINKVGKAIAERDRRWNWPTGDQVCGDMSVNNMYKGKLSDREIQIFSDFLPCAEYGIHTIVSIRIVEIESDVDLLKLNKGEKV